MTPSHDNSPFLTIRCDCGYESHIHESRLGVLAPLWGLLMMCHGCRDVLQFSADEFADLPRREHQPQPDT